MGGLPATTVRLGVAAWHGGQGWCWDVARRAEEVSWWWCDGEEVAGRMGWDGMGDWLDDGLDCPWRWTDVAGSGDYEVGGGG